MKNHRLKATLLALIGLALIVQCARAQVSAVNEDLILGVQALSGTGSSYDYEVNLGLFTTYTSEAPGGTINLSSIVSDADITGTGSSGGFGSNANIVFSVVGTTNGTTVGSVGSGTVFFTATTTPTAETGATLGSGTDNQVSSVYAGLNGQASTSNSAEAAFITATSGNSYTTQENTTNGEFFSLPTTGTASVASGSIALYEDNASESLGQSGTLGTISKIGTFSFVNGTTFEFQAVPEPSTDALMALGGVLLLVVLNKRRNPAVRL
jgi:hypothetical protein